MSIYQHVIAKCIPFVVRGCVMMRVNGALDSGRGYLSLTCTSQAYSCTFSLHANKWQESNITPPLFIAVS